MIFGRKYFRIYEKFMRRSIQFPGMDFFHYERSVLPMALLETNDWMVLNNIIYQINYLKDSREMRENLLKQLLLIIDFDSANFFVTDSDDPRILKNMAGYNFSEKLGEDYVGLYEMLDYQKGLMFDGKSRVYRETDIMEDKKRQETEYYKQFYQPNGWHYSLHASLAFEKRSVGTLALFRRQGKEDFSYKDVFVLEMLQDHLALRLYQDMSEHPDSDPKHTVHECVELYGLTRREEMILRCLVDGLEADVICQNACITNNTLKKHILNIYKKLGIRNRVQMFKLVKEKEN